MPPEVRRFTQNLILGATLIVALLLGRPLVRNAWSEVRHGRLTLEALFLLTMAGALAASLQSHLTGQGTIYYEVVSVLLVVYTLGKLVGTRSQAASTNSQRLWTRGIETSLASAVEAARSHPLSLQARADRLGRVFFPLLVCISLGTFAYWAFLSSVGWSVAFFNAMSVLLVACPCVIGLATPIVTRSALAQMAQRGMLVTDVSVIEKLAELDCVVSETSMAALVHGDLRVLQWAVALSRDAVRAVRRNLFRAVAFNVVGMSLAACGLLHPVMAVILMALSSLSLIFSSTRIGVNQRPFGTEPIMPVASQEAEKKPALARSAIMHGFAIALQGILFLLLLEPLHQWPVVGWVLGGFALAGVGFCYLWHRWATIPHTLDMAFGMLSLGNLGMLLGWWADNGFAPFHDACCCGCVDEIWGGTMHMGMWVGMLAFSNLAMHGLGRSPIVSDRRHLLAMYSGGNLGMLAGMFAGGWWASSLGALSVSSGCRDRLCGNERGNDWRHVGRNIAG